MSDFEQLPFEKLHSVTRVLDQGGIRADAPDTHGKLILASKQSAFLFDTNKSIHSVIEIPGEHRLLKMHSANILVSEQQVLQVRDGIIVMPIYTFKNPMTAYERLADNLLLVMDNKFHLSILRLQTQAGGATVAGAPISKAPGSATNKISTAATKGLSTVADPSSLQNSSGTSKGASETLTVVV